MVTFAAQGRMGNFLFECATAWAYAKKHGLQFTVPHHCSDEFHNPVYLKHLRNPAYQPHLQNVQIVERCHQYMNLPFNEQWKDINITLSGYFQTEKYFKEYRHELLQVFDFKWVPEVDTISIHVRRGDYIALKDKHPIIPDEYYQQAIGYFVGKGFSKFKVFSDDIPYCREYFTTDKFSGAYFYFSEGQTIEEDLVQGSCCLHNINSSSTYSWWMAWLNRNPNKEVITPVEWFTKNVTLDTSDIIPETWIKM